VGLDLSDPGRPNVSRTWYCRHPFHGLALELGDARLEVEQHCRCCGLPREQPAGSGKLCDE
jgi:hypothetical protein